MKEKISCKTLINIVNNNQFFSIDDIKELKNLEVVDIQREPSIHTELSGYEMQTKIYRCLDGFVGIKGVRVVYKSCDVRILKIPCTAKKYTEKTIICFVPDK